MNPTLSRALLWLALGLALVVVGTSSGLRLAANGLGCTPWPQCYGTPATAQRVQASAAAQAARLAHRIAASAYALVVLAAIVLGWRRWTAGARVIALLVVAMTALLAVVGRHTPSPLPAITLVNMVGGLTLLAGTAALLAVRTDGPTQVGLLRVGVIVTLLLAALQAASGAMISVRSAGAACGGGCSARWHPELPRLWAPMLPGSAPSLLRAPGADAALHAVHRSGALVVTVAAVLLVFAPAARAGRLSWPPVVLLALCVAAGIGLSLFEGSLPVALAHVLGAGLLVAALSALPALRASTREAA